MLRALGAFFALAGTSGCWAANHYLVHPQKPSARLVTWEEDAFAGDLWIHLEGARPAGPGPFPAVLVHPEGGSTAVDMRGVVWDLAGRGYVAVAADYRRSIDGEYQRNVFAWRSPADVTAALALMEQRPDVDPDRVAVLGFSQGGVISLLIAAHAPERVCAVVSYYPVTDFPRWLDTPVGNPLHRMSLEVVRWFFRRQSGATTEEEFQFMLREASAFYLADSIRAPVLLVHGDADTTAPVEESERMAEALAANGNDVTLLVVPGGAHIFNFRQYDKASAAWSKTMTWLAEHTAPSTP